MHGKLKYNLLLMLAAFIWGSAIVAQSVGMDFIEPFTFNSIRSFMGSLVLLPVIWVMEKQNEKKEEKPEGEEGRKERETQEWKILLTGGICCGLVLTLSMSLQQVGIAHTTAGKAGFLTALYILIVPVIGCFLGKRVGMKTWLGVILAMIGMYFLCIKEGFFLSYGDFMVFLCACGFAMHILVVDYFSPKVNGVKLSCVQFLVCGTLSAFPMFLFEKPQLALILQAWLPIVYAGLLSSGIAYTLQIITQKHLNPTVASMLMSLESVFAVLSGWVVLHERLSLKELLGCVLVFVAIILAQLPAKKVKQDVS